MFGAQIGTALTIPALKHLAMPLRKFPLRQLNAKKFTPFIGKYVSFYEIDNLDMSNFPSKTMHQKEVSYNAEQFWFFLNFIEKSLNNQALARIYRDTNRSLDLSYLTLNSTLLQARLQGIPGSGREIGNFDFKGTETLVESPKFLEVLDTIQDAGMPKTVVYSNYFENGIQAFAHFLDRHGLQGKYAILKPDLAPEKFAQIVADYNRDTVKLLLLHPEITEGISLKGTRQFHILEPVLNQTILDQVVARAVRYQSHAHLPEAERHVDIYNWKAVIGSGANALKLKKANWFNGYSELNDWSDWGSGMRKIDKNYDRKKTSPDIETAIRLESVNQNMLELKDLMRHFAIENQIQATAGEKHAQ